MSPEQIERNRAFIADLRANNGKEARTEMRNKRGGRCCLCVALDTARRLGFEYPQEYPGYRGTAPKEMAEFYGWPNVNPILEPSLQPATFHNDGLQMSHDKIADLFELTFPEIKPES